ncbi:hypothetical protein EIP86_003827 [Pleurotus ostreatoroseus]|nr:hypothetical protein EIP86_003827 [Pleurotus ostreatoroseus]
MAAIMQLVPLNDDTTDGQLTTIATAVQNVCNATLSLLFTASLFIWGFLVNRKQAWRTDGGTAAFGVGAMVLAVGSTTITFIYIPTKEHYAWMPGLMWAVILWQSFLGWWWWVGSGMGVGEVDEMLRREEKRRRKRKAKLEKREIRKGKAELFWKSVAGAVGYGGQVAADGVARPRSMHSRTPSGEGRPRSRLSRIASNQSTHVSSHTQASSNSTSSGAPSGFLGRVSNHAAVRSVYGWFLLLRQAHLMAAREQAVEQNERMQQVYGNEREPGAAAENPDPAMLGWGLGAYGVRRAEQGERERDYEAERGILEVERAESGFIGRGNAEESLEKQESPVLKRQLPQDFDIDENLQTRRRKNRHTRRDTDEETAPIGDANGGQGGEPSYAYGPPGILGLLHNYYALGCAVFASIGGLLFGYDQGVIANVLVMRDFVERWPVGSWEKGLTSALGSVATTVWLDILTELQYPSLYFIWLHFVFIIGSVLQFCAQNLSDIIVGRAIGGLGIGALSPPEVRGSLMALEQFSIVLGAVWGFWTGYFTRERIQIVPGVLLAVGSVFLPPSPRLLAAHGFNEEALMALAKLRLRTPDEADSDPLLQIELLEMRTETLMIEQTTGRSAKEVGVSKEAHLWAQLFSKKYLRRTLIGVAMMFFQQWSGINALLYYGPTLMGELGLQDDRVTLMVSGGIAIVQFVAVLPVIICIDRLGKPITRI